jgi:hypothetical protein
MLANLHDLGRDQVVVVEKPLRGRRDELALVDVFGQGLVRVAQDAGVVTQPRIDAAGAPPLRIDGETRRQGERPLLEPFGAEQLVTERFEAIAGVGSPGMEEQIPSGNPRTMPEGIPGKVGVAALAYPPSCSFRAGDCRQGDPPGAKRVLGLAGG